MRNAWGTAPDHEVAHPKGDAPRLAHAGEGHGTPEQWTPSLGYDPCSNARVAALPGWAAGRRSHDAARIRDEPAPRCEPHGSGTPHWRNARAQNWAPAPAGAGHPDGGRLRL